MIFLRNLKLQYGERFIFRNASASIGTDDRIALVGSNGAGKTTLLNILAGEETPDDGSIDKANHINIGYLPQDGIVASGKALYSEAESAFSDILDLKGRIERATAELQSLQTDSDAYQKLLEEIGGWERTLEHRDVEGHAREIHVPHVLFRRLHIPESGAAAHAAVQQLLPDLERNVVRAQGLLEGFVALHALALGVLGLPLGEEELGVGGRAEERVHPHG